MPRYSYLRARFTEPDEFVAELAADRDLVERRIVRLTTSRHPIQSGAVTRLLLVAGAIVEGRPVVLERWIGDLWGHGDDERVQREARELLDDLERRLGELELEVRAGILEEAGNA